MNTEHPLIRVTRRFDAWLDSGMIGRWMFGPSLRDEEVVRIVIEARVGGSFSFVVRRQGQDITHIGEYREIIRPRRLVFTWGIAQDQPDMSRVIVDIVALASGCGRTTQAAPRRGGPKCSSHLGQRSVRPDLDPLSRLRLSHPASSCAHLSTASTLSTRVCWET
jgi:uncharacterized protein YndB with AHSA1/START domain